MKQEIHPEIYELEVRCVCGSSFASISTEENISVDICSQCHPFFTGQQKFVDSAGRIEKFQRRFTKK